MARDVLDKVAAGDKLDDDDIAYAVGRSLDLGPEYADKVAGVSQQLADAVRPPTPVFQTGPAYPMPSQGPGVFLSEDDLSKLKNPTLEEIGDVLGIDVSGNKSEMVGALAGSEPVADDSDVDEEDEESE